MMALLAAVASGGSAAPVAPSNDPPPIVEHAIASTTGPDLFTSDPAIYRVTFDAPVNRVEVTVEYLGEWHNGNPRLLENSNEFGSVQVAMSDYHPRGEISTHTYNMYLNDVAEFETGTNHNDSSWRFISVRGFHQI